MADMARGLTSDVALVATEIGMLHQLRRLNQHTTFLPMNPKASCRFMKMTTPELLLRCLREGRDEVVIDAAIAEPARRAVERMVAVGGSGGGGE
jgi:quinolinate synthase